MSRERHQAHRRRVDAPTVVGEGQIVVVEELRDYAADRSAVRRRGRPRVVARTGRRTRGTRRSASFARHARPQWAPYVSQRRRRGNSRGRRSSRFTGWRSPRVGRPGEGRVGETGSECGSSSAATCGRPCARGSRIRRRGDEPRPSGRGARASHRSSTGLLGSREQVR